MADELPGVHGWLMNGQTMKQIILLSLAISSLAGGSLLAGPPDYKQVAPAPPPCAFGTGWYFGLDGGANVYQDIGTSREFTFSNGDIIRASRNQNVGGWGGIKVGYVFGAGTFRPTIEEDLFYNGINTNIHVSLNDVEVAHSSNLINSGAFMTNFIARFAFGKFQPYAGAGVGAYYAAAAGSDITFNRTGNTFHTGGGASSGSLAWQVVAGADYYWTCKMSTFVEYKFLDYVGLDVGNGHKQVGQQLVGAGLRIHF
jgi:opacity protein-like surface antigen